MKNVIRICVKSFCFVLVFSLIKVQAQQAEPLNSLVQTEVNALGKTDTSSSIEKYTVKGTVVDEENLPLAGVNIVLKGTTEGIVTDLDGTFEFPRPLEVNEVLIFSYIGYNPQEYTVALNASETIDLTITFDLSNISLMGAVEVEGVYRSKQNIFQKFLGLFN